MNNDKNLSPELQSALEFSADLLANLQDINNMLTTAEVIPIFQTHFVDTAKEIAGMKDLVVDILKEGNAIGDLTDNRDKLVKVGWYTYQILKQVEIRFTAGSSRYPVSSVRTCLSVHMKRDTRLGKIQLTNEEDKARECNKPRVKWIAIAHPMPAPNANK
jgi:hypothetical protein